MKGRIQAYSEYVSIFENIAEKAYLSLTNFPEDAYIINATCIQLCWSKVNKRISIFKRFSFSKDFACKMPCYVKRNMAIQPQKQCYVKRNIKRRTYERYISGSSPKFSRILQKKGYLSLKRFSRRRLHHERDLDSFLVV